MHKDQLIKQGLDIVGFSEPSDGCYQVNGAKMEQNKVTPLRYECLNSIKIADGTLSLIKDPKGKLWLTFKPANSNKVTDCKIYTMTEGVPRKITCGNTSFMVTLNKDGEVSVKQIVPTETLATVAQPPAPAAQLKPQDLVKTPNQPPQNPRADIQPPQPAPEPIVLPPGIDVGLFLIATAAVGVGLVNRWGKNWEKRHNKKHAESSKSNH